MTERSDVARDQPRGTPATALVVGAAVVDDLERPTMLLAARRTEPSHLAGGWELPGGKVEDDEDPVQALHRELSEELGVSVELGVEIPGPLGPGGVWPMEPAHHMRVWLARVVTGEPAPIEDHDEVRLLGPGQWLDVAWLPADVPIVHALLQRYPSARPGGGPSERLDGGPSERLDGGLSKRQDGGLSEWPDGGSSEWPDGGS